MNYLDRVDLFEGLTESQVNALVERSRMRVFAANTIVVSEGDEGNSLFIIQNGSLKAFLTDNVGREVTLSLLDPGDYFGELALLDEAPRSASVMAVTRSEVLQIPRTAFLELIEVYPACLQLVVRNLVGRIRLLTESVRSLALVDVFGRISRVFDSLAVEQDGLLLIDRRLTQQDLANMVGASREMVNRILRDLVAGGYIEIEQQRILLCKKLPRHW
ncbi:MULTISPECIES: Crp/Fnr family transcriptional regulator [Zoogloea]|nr:MULTISPECIES: Crp/Fnr family transcriptional regulator [Zoogloea]MBP8133066.1 Crp/Fnr family transcriptional regulator [Zoogloea sp.]MBT9495838.1 Crp/Fnr family transcriptional regulator [Zoogloea sp.]MDD2669060.1 Crp/Fnr family transcriptional regulator [Zoogloea sp.]MDY0036467.1 Crp/Fnr family transcriptional regulator [Zoogloea oleivorans]